VKVHEFRFDPGEIPGVKLRARWNLQSAARPLWRKHRPAPLLRTASIRELPVANGLPVWAGDFKRPMFVHTTTSPGVGKMIQLRSPLISTNQNHGAKARMGDEGSTRLRTVPNLGTGAPRSAL